ncbi:TraM recognition domain-containing protein [Bosea sp. (in: a-proteobacteria)]|uniref:TraM recognition domain-containing protein n=1 Tax=Bosea sp. (in: a-proteobacteria) TaxID=1871050 RepID=UPI003F6F7114
MARARKENAIVYFCLPALAYPQFANFLGKLIINDIKATASTATTPWRIILDEFSVFSGPQVLNLINMGRSHGISAILATQSFADIAQGAERNGDKFLDQVIGSINTFMTYRLNAPSDCEIIAGISGTLEGVEFTVQTVEGVGTGAASARHTRTFRIHPDAVRNLEIGEAIYINKSRRPEARDNYLKLKSRRPSW